MVTILIVLMVSLSCQSTFLLNHHLRWGGVRASGSLTLAFVGLTLLWPLPAKETLWAAWLGGSFLGMSDRDLLGQWALFYAGLLYSVLFLYVLPLNVGIGGALGLAAFVSCGLIRWAQKLAPKLSP